MATQYHVLMAFARTPEVVLVAIQVMYDTSGRVIHVQEKTIIKIDAYYHMQNDPEFSSGAKGGISSVPCAQTKH
jgi:hypothetical protein